MTLSEHEAWDSKARRKDGCLSAHKLRRFPHHPPIDLVVVSRSDICGPF